VLILTGYLQNTFARHTPLSLSARLVFEQSYAGVEGDSASSAELYALLSALADAPIFQGIAVTGSVNQNGDIQAIGGVNEKVEGFFDVCSVSGLTGSQGVVIPQSNVQNLMLREDVVEAVEAGQFHIWPVSRIEEGIQLLTGLPTGTRDESGAFPDNSLFHSVESALKEFHEILRRSGQAGRSSGGDSTAGRLDTSEDD
jgi:predicted ATP-dependent protease